MSPIPRLTRHQIGKFADALADFERGIDAVQPESDDPALDLPNVQCSAGLAARCLGQPEKAPAWYHAATGIPHPADPGPTKIADQDPIGGRS